MHSSENFYLCPASDAPSGEMVNVVSKITSTDNLFWVSLLDGFCRMSVPLFMITSAYLLCPLKPEQTWTSFFKRRALRIVPPMIVFLVLYSALPLLWGGTTIEQAIDNILYIPLNFPGAAGPHVVPLPAAEPLRAHPHALAVARKGFGATGTAHNRPVRPKHDGSVLQLLRPRGVRTSVLESLPYTLPLLGLHRLPRAGALHKVPHQVEQRTAVGIPALAVGAAFTILSFYNQVELGVEQHPNVVEIAWVFCSPNVLLATFGFFLIISTINRPMRGYKLIEDISKKSYGMYLMHMFYLVMYAGLIIPHLHVSLAIPAIAICTFVSCYITTKIISYIPGSKWVIG